MLKTWLLSLYRLAILVAIAWILREHAVRVRFEGFRPVTIEEVREILPSAAALQPDAGERAGADVLDAAGSKLGYVLQTAPISDSIVGYRGWTNALIAFDPALRVLGVKIRASQDTDDHVADVKGDAYFIKTWDGKSWEEVARETPEEAEIEGVSGATMTSLAMAEGIVRRLRAADSALAQPPQSWRFAPRDLGLVLFIAAAMWLAFRGTHGKRWLRTLFQCIAIGYVGFWNGDLIAQSLVVGWAQNGVPYRLAPGMVLLLAAALIIPWTTGKPLYCQHICPHGHAQEFLSRAMPSRWRLRLPKGIAAGLRWLPPLTIGCVFTIAILALPADLAGVEPFDAYLWKAAGWATITVAIIGLAASAFVPMAYCHYGCPTGALLNFVRKHGAKDSFGRREFSALLLVVLAACLSWKSAAIRAWLESSASDWIL
jgi:NosR/NirI family transcriptional regulator, nitrous oxide reductase regulator